MMKRTIHWLLLAANLLAFSSTAQVQITKGDLKLEIGGVLSTYYNQRWILPEASNQSLNKNRFKLRDARFFLQGEIGKNYEFKLQADLSSIGATEFDPETPILYDANFTYKGIRSVQLTVGYGKLPYSRSSLVPFSRSPYWQRAEAFRGDLYSRRDVGIMASKTFWDKRIRLFAGAYTGVGEVFYQGDNDPSGGLEYVGRVECAYPRPYAYRDIDDDVSDKLQVAVGANIRYTKRDLPAGTNFIVGQKGVYGLKAINGERTGMGADAALFFKGFSLVAETETMRATPNDPNDPGLQGLPHELTGGYFLFGGWATQLSYFSKPLHTIVSARYDEMDLNDLTPGNAARFSASLAYQLKGYKSMIKAQYFNILREESLDPQRYRHQFRIGWQLALD